MGGELTVQCSWFTVHDSQFTVHDSQFTVHDSRFTIRSSRFTIRREREGNVLFFHRERFLSDEIGSILCLIFKSILCSLCFTLHNWMKSSSFHYRIKDLS